MQLYIIEIILNDQISSTYIFKTNFKYEGANSIKYKAFYTN